MITVTGKYINKQYEIYEIYKSVNTRDANDFLKAINNNLNLIKDTTNYKNKASKRESYLVKSHYMPFDLDGYNIVKYNKKYNGKVFRKEEWMCKICMGKSFQCIGEIVDYQVPLKHNMKDCKGMGKIDLLSVISDKGYLLELKVPDSTEHPLKAIMEIYTYWQQLGGNNTTHFIQNSKVKGIDKLKKAIIIFEKDEKSSFYMKLEKNKFELTKLMKDLEIECFVAELSKVNEDEIINIKRY